MKKEGRILCIRGGGLGDFILIIPLLRALRLNRPHSRIEMLGHLEYARLARAIVNDIRSIDLMNLSPLFLTENNLTQEGLPLVSYLRSFQTVINFLPDPGRVMQRNISRLVEEIVCISPPDPDGNDHASDHFIQESASLGIRLPALLPEVDPSEKDRLAAHRHLQALLANPSKPFVAIHPRSGGSSKNWPAVNFAEVIHWLHQESSSQLLLLSGEADTETTRAVLEMVKPLSPPCIQELPATELSAVLSRAHLYLGNDSGVSHLAAACGAPSIVLFGPTSPRVWAPRGPRVKIIENAGVPMVKEAILESLI